MRLGMTPFSILKKGGPFAAVGFITFSTRRAESSKNGDLVDTESRRLPSTRQRGNVATRLRWLILEAELHPDSRGNEVVHHDTTHTICILDFNDDDSERYLHGFAVVFLQQSL